MTYYIFFNDFLEKKVKDRIISKYSAESLHPKFDYCSESYLSKFTNSNIGLLLSSVEA